MWWIEKILLNASFCLQHILIFFFIEFIRIIVVIVVVGQFIIIFKRISLNSCKYAINKSMHMIHRCNSYTYIQWQSHVFVFSSIQWFCWTFSHIFFISFVFNIVRMWIIILDKNMILKFHFCFFFPRIVGTN